MGGWDKNIVYGNLMLKGWEVLALCKGRSELRYVSNANGKEEGQSCHNAGGSVCCWRITCVQEAADPTTDCHSANLFSCSHPEMNSLV